MKLWCCGCNKYVEAELCGGDRIYPHRPDLYNLWFYQCPHCKNYVGTHKKWGMGTNGRKHNIRALGCIPTPELKKARHKIHEILDPLWQGNKPSGTRKRIYKRLSNALGYEYHTGNTRTIEECRTVYRLVKKIAEEEKIIDIAKKVSKPLSEVLQDAYLDMAVYGHAEIKEKD